MRQGKSVKLLSIIVIVAVFIALGIGAAILLSEYGKSKNDENSDSQWLEGIDPNKQVEVGVAPSYLEKMGEETFTIFGVDSRTDQLGSGTRSDSIMIVYVNHDEKKVNVASVYRDCMVHIEDYGYQKITHAHQFGGPELALSTVNENFDLLAENYITVNFESVSMLVDLLEGIEFTITDAEASVLGGRFTSGGTYILSGDEAVSYSRIRNLEGWDFKRAERQREILFCIFEKAKDLPDDERVELVELMVDEINTSYSSDEIVDILYYLQKYEISEMAAFPEVFYGGTVEGAWVEVPVTLVDMNAALHKFLYGETDYEPSETVQTYSSVLEGKVSGPNYDFREE